MVNQYARGEHIITEALRNIEPDARIPTVLKQRVERLRGHVDKNANAAIDQFATVLSQRNAIVHGDGLLTVDRQARWMLRLTYYDREGPMHVAIMESEADALRAELRMATTALRTALKA